MINEVDYDQVGTDGNGFVELKNVGTSSATLDGIALVLVNGGDGQEYERVALSGTLAAGAYLVVPVEMQNGAPDGLALIDTATKALLDALSYEGEIHTATIDGQVYDLVEGTALPASVADSNSVDGSLSRLPDGSGHERRRDRLGVHDDEDARSGERRVVLAHELPRPADDAGRGSARAARGVASSSASSRRSSS